MCNKSLEKLTKISPKNFWAFWSQKLATWWKMEIETEKTAFASVHLHTSNIMEEYQK